MKIIKLDAIDSTNSYLKSLLNKENLDDFSVVTAKHQKKGKGRNGNIWENEPSLNLAFSIYKKFDKFPILEKFYLNIIASVSVFELLEKYDLKNINIKWPNDIMTENKKISGILIENNIKGNLITHSIIGIGINVNQRIFKNIPNATSTYIQTGLTNSVEKLAENLQEIFKKKFLDFEKNASDLLFHYNKHLFQKNIKAKYISKKDEIFFGKIISVDEYGTIEIEKSNGDILNFKENEIKIKI